MKMETSERKKSQWKKEIQRLTKSQLILLGYSEADLVGFRSVWFCLLSTGCHQLLFVVFFNKFHFIKEKFSFFWSKIDNEEEKLMDKI